jgi:hypothetical protein
MVDLKRRVVDAELPASEKSASELARNAGDHLADHEADDQGEGDR